MFSKSFCCYDCSSSLGPIIWHYKDLCSSPFSLAKLTFSSAIISSKGATFFIFFFCVVVAIIVECVGGSSSSARVVVHNENRPCKEETLVAKE